MSAGLAALEGNGAREPGRQSGKVREAREERGQRSMRGNVHFTKTF